MNRTILAVMIAVAAAAPARAADTLESIKKQIHSKVSAYRSMEFKIHMDTTIDNPQMTMKNITDVTAQYSRKGEKVLSRTESKVSTNSKFSGMEQKSDMTTLDVSDGDSHTTYSEVNGQKSATKRKIDPKNEPSPFDPMGGFALQEKNFIIKVLPDETIDGKSMFVLEMTPKDAEGGSPIGKTKVYYDKANGISMKSIGYDETGKVMSTMVTSDVKLNSTISPDRFIFKAPAGVTVKEESKGGE